MHKKHLIQLPQEFVTILSGNQNRYTCGGSHLEFLVTLNIERNLPLIDPYMHTKMKWSRDHGLTCGLKKIYVTPYHNNKQFCLTRYGGGYFYEGKNRRTRRKTQLARRVSLNSTAYEN